MWNDIIFRATYISVVPVETIVTDFTQSGEIPER
jgi:hypothetical protein